MAEPRVSFIIPAHDEEACIADAVRAIRTAADAADEPYEVIVVDDASTDRTAELAADAGARVVRADVRQISRARNAGAAAARGEWFVFVDADTIVDAPVVASTIAAFGDGAAGGGALVRFDDPIPRYVKLILPMTLALYRACRLAAGCYIFATRTAFEAVGGFDPTLYAGEEVYLSRALRKQGRFVLLREPVVTSGRKLRCHSAREIFGTMFSLAIRGKRGVRDRSRLDLWYGERLADPALDERPVATPRRPR